MRKNPRPYQLQAINDIKRSLRDFPEPILVNASVGAGKSLILSEVLLSMERLGFRSLCLTLNSSLIQQNADTYNLQGGNAGIYCAGLNAKAHENIVIFASPHSVCQDIRNEYQISRQPFKLIVIDECHNINAHDHNSMYMRIINHYGLMAQSSQYGFRVIGLTGTPYRGKSESIVGEGQFFKREICNISMSWLIDRGFLVKPIFGIPQTGSFDFSQLQINNNGKFDQRQLSEITNKNIRLTGKIMHEVASVVESQGSGAFIFASTRRHCEECAQSLPEGAWAIITGDTPHLERKEILEKAKNGHIKYLISVNCLTVGIDIPNFDVCAWLRPTESLVLYTQGVGRVLRLHPGKKRAIVLDYAQNLERHGDIDDPLINEALQPKEKDDPNYEIQCHDCNTMNTITARRCIGVKENKRCDHYFEFKECPKCWELNDKVARACRKCSHELINPNSKLSLNQQIMTGTVLKMSCHICASPGGFPNIYATYIVRDQNNQNHVVTENFYTNSKHAKNICYSNFVKMHIENPSKYYMLIDKMHGARAMLEKERLIQPKSLVCTLKGDGTYKIKNKVFDKTHQLSA